MNKKFLIAWVVVFVVWMLGSFGVHAVLLGSDYAQLPNLYRTDADSANYLPFMLLAHVSMAGALVWIYARGVAAAPWMGQGIRFGVAVAFLTAIPTYTIYYAVQPLPATLVVKQIIGDGVLVVLLGMVAAWFHREAPSTG